MAKSSLSIEERFFAKVIKTDTCWLWTSAVGGSLGYGVFWVGGKARNSFAHRFSWEIANGKIPKGTLVLHKCDNPLCVNPAHLFLGSPQDNMTDKKNKRRHSYGESNLGGGKLTWKKVAEIRGASIGCLRLARQYGVSATTIKAIRKNRIWRQEMAPC